MILLGIVLGIAVCGLAVIAGAIWLFSKINR